MYYVMQYDKPLISFTLGGTSNRYMLVDISEAHLVDSGNIAKKILSCLNTWLEMRKPPRSRAYIESILSATGVLSFTSLVDVTRLLSLQDAFWVKQEVDTATWASVNLYTNSFNEVLMHTAFYGGGLHGLPVRSTSPEFGTDGVLPKCWRRENGEVILCKGGTSGARNAGREPYNEVYISQLADFLGISCVKYDIGKFKQSVVSKCKLFTSENEGFVSAYDLFRDDRKATFEAMYNLYAWADWSEQLRDMYLLDALTLNRDRHLGNFGVLRDNHTMQVLRPAPIYDNGNGFVPFYSELPQTVKPWTEQYAFLLANEGYFTNFGLPYDYHLKRYELIGARQRAMLLKAQSFKIQVHPKLHLDAQRVQFLEGMVRWLAKRYLEM